MKTLLPFQRTGAHFLASHFHAANADQPGLGKTVQAIHAAAMVNAKSALVTCPASVRTNWQEHVEEHFGHTSGWDIISYNAACDKDKRNHLKPHYDVWIGDEIHFCKNFESQRTAAILGSEGLARRATYKWPLSGTLAPNGRPVELFPMLKTLCPAFKDMTFNRYLQYYCGAYFDGQGMNTKGATHLSELAELLQGFMIRRTKVGVFPNRKAPLISPGPIKLSASDLQAVLAAEDEIGGREVRISSRHDKFSQMGDTSKLLHLLGIAMVPYIGRFVDDLLHTVEKVVIFAHHVDVMQQLVSHFANRKMHPVLYRGGMTDSQKDDARRRFVSFPECRVFIGQRQAAGTGINDLQKASSTCVIAEPSWVPGETEQLIDRLDRMGACDDIVNCYMMYAKGTLSEVVVKVHGRKENNSERIMQDDVLKDLA